MHNAYSVYVSTAVPATMWWFRGVQQLPDEIQAPSILFGTTIGSTLATSPASDVVDVISYL